MNVYSEVRSALRRGHRAYLATIIRSRGPVPAPLQSKMLVVLTPRPEVTGTVGGGCLDASVINLISGASEGPPPPVPGGGFPLFRTFTLDDELGDTAMTCGGTVEVFIERIDQGVSESFDLVGKRLREGKDTLLVSPFGAGSGAGKYVLDTSGTILHPPGGVLPSPLLTEFMSRTDPDGSVLVLRHGEGGYLLEYIEAPPVVVVFGGGHVGQAVARIAGTAGFSVTVVDDRPEFADPGRFPGGTKTLCLRSDRIPREMDLTERTFVVIATRGHKNDEEILGQCLKRDLMYVGMIGSRRKVALTLRSLESAGVPKKRLDRVHAPIGVDIGARTPGEIGVSIVAQMVSVRRSTGRT